MTALVGIVFSLTFAQFFLPDGPPWPTVTVDQSIYQEMAPIDDASPDAYYFAQKIPFSPIDQLRTELEELTEQRLKHRGEAHITVITPPEYRQVLSEFLTMQEIHHLAYAFGLQDSPFHIACLGRGVLRNKNEEIEKKTYFLLIESPRLIEFREKIQIIYEQRGGVPGGFLAHQYFPHITVGFTHRDLHESDGVIKNPKTCWARAIVN